MTLETFFLICFGVGFVFSFVSFFAGALHLHLPTKFHVNIGHHAHVPHAHVGHAPHGNSSGTNVDLTHLSAFNMPSIMAFLAWFGGAGYLTSHYYAAGLAASLLVSIAGGLFGGAIVYFFLSKLMSYDGSLDPADCEMVGVIGTVNRTIREGGTGEIIFLQRGTRRGCGARSENGSTMLKGSEVVVTRFEKGIAYVKHWEEFAESGSSLANS